MNHTKSLAFRTVVLIIFIFCAGAANGQQQNQDEMMKAWAAYMTPGEMHALLAKTEGEWDTDMSMWMDPSGQPMKASGVSTNKMIMGGRYQQSSYKGNIMGQPMEGQGTTGYDNSRKVFESTWIDNMGTGIMKAEGTYDPATKTLVLKGKQQDFSTGKEMPFREVMKFIDDNTHIMEMYITPAGGQEFKSMEIKFTRKQ